jgi:hypothetical protein
MGTDFLFAMPSFWSGAARVVDISGSLDMYNASRSGREADALAARLDWIVVGKDIETAIDSYRDDDKPTAAKTEAKEDQG